MKQASRMLTHYKRTNPAGIAESLMASGITIQGVTDMARDSSTPGSGGITMGQSATNRRTSRTGRRATERSADSRNGEAREQGADELVLGREQHRKMHLDTGQKFDTIQEWMEHMEGRDAELLASRRQAAKDMRLIAAGRQIIQEEGQEAADRFRQAALDAGLTGDEEDEDE